jgi:hypothetical protein
LPWSDEGYRLLPGHFNFELSARMREFEQSFSKQIEEFLDFWPELSLFREEDYPSADVLRQKFGLKLEVLPIPSADDFRVTMSAEEQARVAREIDANVRQSIERELRTFGTGSRAWSAIWPTGSTNRNPDSMRHW